MKRKDEKPEVTVADARNLLLLNGQSALSDDRIKITRLILQNCIESDVELVNLDEPLYPALAWDDIEMFYAIEEGLDMEIDVDDPTWLKMETFADLISCVEARPAFLRNLLANEKANVATAYCGTQAAFYALRRRLCFTGAAYHKIHGLRPTLPLMEIPIKHAEPLAESLSKDYGLSLPLQRVLWSKVDATSIQWAFFFILIVACFYVASYLPLPFLTGTLLCILANVAFARLVGHHARYKWPKEYQTLGDVARKIASLATVASPQVAL